jgi:hypothetical protein
MKKLMLAVIFVFILYSGAVLAADLNDEFLGVKWGTRASSLSKFSKVRENRDVTYHVNPTEVHVINDIKIPHVVYGFYLDQLFAVYIRIDTIEVYNEIKTHMISKYGIPSSTVEMKNKQETHKWKYQKVKMKLKLNAKAGNMKLAFYFTPLSNKVNQGQQEKFYEKSFRLFPIDKENKPTTLPSIPLLRF